MMTAETQDQLREASLAVVESIGRSDMNQDILEFLEIVFQDGTENCSDGHPV